MGYLFMFDCTIKHNKVWRVTLCVGQFRLRRCGFTAAILSRLHN